MLDRGDVQVIAANHWIYSRGVQLGNLSAASGCWVAAGGQIAVPKFIARQGIPVPGISDYKQLFRIGNAKELCVWLSQCKVDLDVCGTSIEELVLVENCWFLNNYKYYSDNYRQGNRRFQLLRTFAGESRQT